jgi:hypothetical protein
MCNKIALFFHIGNSKIGNIILKEYPNFFNNKNIDLFVTYYDDNFENVISKKILEKSKINIKVLNKGMDIGGFFKILEYFFENNLENNYINFIKIHTKSDKSWRDKLIMPIYKNLKKIFELTDFKKPIIFSCSNIVDNDLKGVNRKYFLEHVLKYYNWNNDNKNIIINFYPDNFYSNKNNESKNDLFFDENFYKNIEKLDKNHWNNYGKNEFHRISNFNYFNIKKNGESYSGYNYVPGTIFVFNKIYLNLLKKINFKKEFEVLENEYVKNDKISKTHSWEYFFGFLLKIYNSNIICLNTSKIIKYENYIFNNIHSIINQPFYKSKIAIFLYRPLESGCGGYRTLLRYINIINLLGESVDIYLDTELVWKKKNYKVSFENIDLIKAINIINDYNEIDCKKNNFYSGFKLQKSYDLLLANAYNVAKFVYNQKNLVKNIGYIIQDLEYLFIKNDKTLVNFIKSTYKKEYKYYCLSNFLFNKFSKMFPQNYVKKSILGFDQNIYYDKNEKRENSILFAYYPNKFWRLPKFVSKLIKLLSKKYKCYVYPYRIKIKSKNIINCGFMTTKELNDLYNRFKIGVVFSISNPSRIAYEMKASGLEVIEYKCICTSFDFDDSFNLINKNIKNNQILKLIENLMNKNKNKEKYLEFLRNNNNNQENSFFKEFILDNIV